MHSLLAPTTHAELDILSQRLVLSGYYEGESDQAYLKMFLGTTLGLTVLESLHGITVENGKTLVLATLLERVIKRADILIDTSRTDTNCSIKLTKGGKLLGQLGCDQAEFNPPLHAQALYEVVLAKVARILLPDLFPHKFYVRAELSLVASGSATHPNLETAKQAVPAASRDNLTTADKLEDKIGLGKRKLAEASQRLVIWQTEADSLNPDEPSDWEEHANKLNGLEFLGEDERIDLLEQLKQLGKSKGVGYNLQKSQFYLIAHHRHEKQPV